MGEDEALVRACRAGDDRAWRALVERYVRLVRAIPLNIGLSPADADDVTQLTFATLLAGLDSITEPDRLGAWLSTVAKRQSWRHVERQRRETPADHALAPDPTPFEGSDPDAAGRRLEDVEWVHQGLLRLDPRCRGLLVALYFSGGPRPYTEVAAELAIPTGSIGPTRARCLAKLRSHLEELGGP